MSKGTIGYTRKKMKKQRKSERKSLEAGRGGKRGKREKVLKEMYKSEEVYLNNLTDLCTSYVAPLVDLAGKSPFVEGLFPMSM